MAVPPFLSMRAQPLGERGRGFPQTQARSPRCQRELDPDGGQRGVQRDGP